MDPGVIFPPVLSLEAERDLRERLRAQRLAQFRALLPESEKFGALATYVRAVGRLHSSSAERAMAYLDTWPTTYFISRVLHDGLDPSAAAGRLLSGLLFESSDDGSSPLWGLDFTLQTDAEGSVVVPAQAGRLVISGLRRESQTLHWKCEAHRALVSTAESSLEPLEVPLPIRPGGSGPVSFLPCPAAQPWEIPLFDHGRHLLLHFSRTPDTTKRLDGYSAALSLDQSLRGAFAALESTWPECIRWVKALTPAFAELEDDYTPGKRQSGSFGPGIPIYLTRVPEEYLHAEDVLHETQHQRFQLSVPADEWFGSWPCRTTLFVSPYRTDLRPLAGLHVGIHAFVTVNEFRRRHLTSSGWNDAIAGELASLHEKNVFALRAILANEVMQTQEAKTYYATLAMAMAGHQEFLDSHVPPHLLPHSTLALERHLENVRRHSGCEASHSRATVEELTRYARSLSQGAEP